jgi:hypothetical protein
LSNSAKGLLFVANARGCGTELLRHAAMAVIAKFLALNIKNAGRVLSLKE